MSSLRSASTSTVRVALLKTAISCSPETNSGIPRFAPGIAMASTPATGMIFAIHSVGVPGIAHELNEDKNFNQPSYVMCGS
jgi:hypothetical protein